MKTFQILFLALIVACASAFAPVSRSAANSALSMKSSVSEQQPIAAALTGFATAAATPFVALADFDVEITPSTPEVTEVAAVVSQAASSGAVDEGTVIGYGAGLVACVVSLAVGFAIGYGTLERPGK